MIVTNATMFVGNPYHDLIYSALQGRYEAVKGTADDAIARLRRNESRMLHVHWEENPLRKCESAVEARLVQQRISASLREFSGKGGKIVWTVHNRLPHELEFTEELMGLRQSLAQHADRIIVHNTAAIEALQAQVDVPFSKFYLLPHPSYADIYPPATAVRRRRGDILFFGLLRAYKGLENVIEAIEKPSQIKRGFALRVRGDVLPNDPYAEQVEVYGRLPGVDLKIGRVENEDVEALFRTVSAVVLPYERFLTSGVAMLALTFGTPVIAPDTPQMRELLPMENLPLLYEKGSRQGLRDAITLATTMPKAELEAIIAANLARADEVHPQKVSTELGDLYDHLLSQ